MKLLFWFEKFIGIIARLLTVVSINFIAITYSIWTSLIPLLFLFLTKFYLEGIDADSSVRACLLSLVLIIVIALSLSIFVSFFGSFGLMLKSLEFLRPEFWGLRFLFNGPRILHWRALSIRFNGYQTIALGIVLICDMGLGARFENYFCLSVNYFFDYLIEAIELPVAFFDFYSHWGFQVFLGIMNHYAFLWSSVLLKFYQYRLQIL